MLNFLSTWIAGTDGTVAPADIGYSINRTIDSGAKGELTTLKKLSNTISQQIVCNEVEEASKAEAAAMLAAQYVQARGRRMRAAAQMYASHGQHASNVMSTAQQVARTDARHGKALLKHDLAMGVQKSEVRGYELAMQNARGLVGSDW